MEKSPLSRAIKELEEEQGVQLLRKASQYACQNASPLADAQYSTPAELTAAMPSKIAPASGRAARTRPYWYQAWVDAAMVG